MIKLPDLSACVEVQQLLFSMGVTQLKELPVVKFTRRVERKVTVIVKNTKQLEYAHQLHIGDIPLGKGEEFRDNNGLIEINGLKACVYIKDQREQYFRDSGKSSYRFHLCWCHTIEDMVRGGRKDRYVATTRDDGLFPVNIQRLYSHEKKDIPLELCHNCKKILIERGMYFELFSLAEFYKRYQTNIAETFTLEETHVSEEQYAPNHDDIAREYKKAAKYKCGLCSVDCSNDKDLLHLHHVDGNGQNNKHYNLKVLCVECHANSYRHAHMKKTSDFTDKVRRIRALRRAQNITTLHRDEA